jgi:pimeloyl-ACP methyl ester carboxylesterase
MGALNGKNVTIHVMGTGRPLVLLHCLGVDHRFWDFAAPLADHFTLLRYDLPGHGETSPIGLQTFPSNSPIFSGAGELPVRA